MRKTVLLMLAIITIFAMQILAQDSGTFKDERDDQEYKWVRIGNQVWMAENLNYNSGKGSVQYDRIYGRLYNWKTAKNVCPKGWHLPSDEEWKVLERTLGMREDEINNESYLEREFGNIGMKLKSKSGWKFYVQNGNGIDLCGFSALPGGYYQYYSERFIYYGSGITFWTSTSFDNEKAITRELGSHFDGIGREPYYKVHGCYVRCVRNY